MQFIDQAPAYKAKSLSLQQALGAGRAKLETAPGCERLAICFRPELEVANAFDRSIHERLKFNDLTTPEKLDLLIAELLPGFYHPENLPLSGQDSWTVRFLIDGTVERTLFMDGDGIRAIDGQASDPAIELETDIMTLMALLRSTIADFHRNTTTTSAPGGIAALSPDDAAQIRGGAPATPASDT